MFGDYVVVVVVVFVVGPLFNPLKTKRVCFI
jgi:hypothetical protein